MHKLVGLSDIQKQVVRAVEFQLPMVRTLPDPDRSKCLMCLSYEYFILDMEELAYPLLEEADPEYFKDQLAKDMAEDENITTIVLRIMDKLIDVGVVIVKAKDE
ncbi:MAG TPA: hypothetical protein VMV86_01340 [Methanosarcinales archaeon]|nr:hypothetical protein [Methanosarcinales archaeon]